MKPDCVEYDPLSQAAWDTLFQAVHYLKDDEKIFLRRASDFAYLAHLGQKRKSGEPYITHPMAVATQVAQWRLDVKALACALMHDVLEDTGVSKQELAEAFDSSIADIVDGLSKLEKLEYENQAEHQAESFRKMILAMVKDLRVLVIKLADRLHNMRTLGVMRPEKRRRIAKETLEIYAQLANRIGMNPVYCELQDLSFRHLYPNRYQVLQRALNKWRRSRRDVVTTVLRAMTSQLIGFNIEGQIKGREKNLYSIFQKMRSKQLRFSQVMDIYGFRIIVRSSSDCYRALGALHALYKPKPGKIKDYIAIPKSNGYQSLHSTLIGPYGLPIEVQIRTREMDEIAEIGMAGHWIYKSQKDDKDAAQMRTHQWLQNILDIQADSDNALEFAEHVKVDLFPDEVYIFTPRGKIMVLPRGATPIDFAYAVHTDIGHQCVGAKVNNQLVPLRYKLHTSDTVEIITQEGSNPNPAWLSFVVSARARSAIRSRVKDMNRQDAIDLGEKLLQKALVSLLPKDLTSSEDIKDKYLLDLQKKNISFEDVLFDVGMGRTLPISVAIHIAELAGKVTGDEVRLSPIKISGSESGSVHLAPCCQPIPGDGIKALLLQGQGLVIHRDNCANIVKSTPDNVLDADWEGISQQRTFRVRLSVSAEDITGLLATAAATISEHAVDIESVETPSQKQEGVDGFIEFIFGIRINHLKQLQDLTHDLHSIPQVRKITRL